MRIVRTLDHDQSAAVFSVRVSLAPGGTSRKAFFRPSSSTCASVPEASRQHRRGLLTEFRLKNRASCVHRGFFTRHARFYYLAMAGNLSVRYRTKASAIYCRDFRCDAPAADPLARLRMGAPRRAPCNRPTKRPPEICRAARRGSKLTILKRTPPRCSQTAPITWKARIKNAVP